MQPDDLAPAVGIGRHRDYGGDRDNAVALALLQNIAPEKSSTSPQRTNPYPGFASPGGP